VRHQRHHAVLGVRPEPAPPQLGLQGAAGPPDGGVHDVAARLATDAGEEADERDRPVPVQRLFEDGRGMYGMSIIDTDVTHHTGLAP
jgi:hypothetical protein